MKTSALKTSKFLTKDDAGEGILVTMRKLTEENVEMEGKPERLKWILHFDGNFKPLVLNSTNIASIERIHGDETDEWMGKQIVLPYANPENFISGATSDITGTSDTQILASSGATLRTYVTQILVTNSHATVGTFVLIKDGASTTLYSGYAAPAGGGFSCTFPVPLRGTANTILYAACATTGSNVRVSASGYKGA